ncbi:MAG: hypothetical protein ACE5H9_06220 [Anaerolineae bacterium]
MEIIISAALTLMVLSYILGDNPLFRVAEHVFVGVSIGYAVLVAFHNVFVPFIFRNQSIWLALPPLVLCLALTLKILPTQMPLTSALGGIALAFLIGVGAALAVGGGLFGTLHPQAADTARLSFNAANPAYQNTLDAPFFLDVEFLKNLIVLLGTLGTLFYFTFALRPQKYLGGFREGFVRFWGGMGRWVILITLGALFANTVSARLALLLGRLQFLADSLQILLGGQR